MVLRLVLAVISFAVVLAGCASNVSGTALPASAPGGEDIPTYREPSDGGGFSTQLLDQPLPLPVKGASNWCGWLDSVLPDLRPLGAVTTKDTASGCQFEMQNGQGAQVHVYGPYQRLTQSTAVLRPVEIAGIKGRVYAFDEPPVTFCSVSMDVRAYAALAVDGYDLASDEAGDREAHCELAKRVAEVLIKKFVPLAGGTPWPQTRQQPLDDALTRAEVCEVVDFTDAFYGGISVGRNGGRKGSTALGPTCVYQDKYATATVQVVTARDGLAALPKRSGARAQDGKFGLLPSRTEQTTDKCLLSVQFGNGQVLQLEFAPNHERDHAITCLSAQVILASATSTLLAEAT